MRRALLVTLLVVVGAPASASAEDQIVRRKLKFAEKGKHLVVSGTFTDVFDEAQLEELSSGFATSVVLRAYVYRKGQDAPVAASAATFRVVYDLWDEIYEVRITDSTGERNVKRRTRAEALKEVTTLLEFPVAALDDVEIGPHHYVGVIVEVNPVSPELLAEVRRWIARPRGGQDVAGSSSFFGSFVSIFVNPKISEADRTLRIRSQDVYRVER
jgi:hypothetical protein